MKCNEKKVNGVYDLMPFRDECHIGGVWEHIFVSCAVACLENLLY